MGGLTLRYDGFCRFMAPQCVTGKATERRHHTAEKVRGSAPTIVDIATIPQRRSAAPHRLTEKATKPRDDPAPIDREKATKRRHDDAE